MLKIHLSEPIHPKALAYLKERFFVTSDPEDLRDVTALLTRNLTIDRAFLDRCPNLKVIGIHGTGTDGVDLSTAKERGIRVTYSPYENADSVAELIVGLMLVMTRHLHVADRLIQTGSIRENAPAALVGHELRGKTFGMIGTGTIARKAAMILKNGFGMKVIGTSPTLTKERAEDLGIEFRESPEDVFKESDYLNIGVPLKDDTRALIGRELLQKAKKGAILINTSRGAVIDENALFEALTNGTLSAAAVDVLTTEPPEKDNPLLTLSNFFVTPHIGAATEEALLRVGMKTVTQMADLLEGRTPEYEL